MASNQAFSPVTGGTVLLTVSSATSVNTTLTGTFSNSVLVTSGASVLMYVRISQETTPVATSLDTPVLPSTQVLFSTPQGTVKVATCSSSTSGTLFFTSGY